MKTYFSRPALNKTVSGLLVFWLSGLIFLFCCEMPKAQAAETDSCPLAKISHCDKQTAGESDSSGASFQIYTRALNCCRLVPAIFDKARKIEQIPQTSEALTTPEISSPKFSIVERKIEFVRTYRPPVLNRGGTYLKNRVFRI